jgi:hypothetical protein
MKHAMTSTKPNPWIRLSGLVLSAFLGLFFRLALAETVWVDPQNKVFQFKENAPSSTWIVETNSSEVLTRLAAPPGPSSAMARVIGGQHVERADGRGGWTDAGFRAPPPGMTYRAAHADQAGNLLVELDGITREGTPVRGFNVQLHGGPVIVWSKMQWGGGFNPQGFPDLQNVVPLKNGFSLQTSDGQWSRLELPTWSRREFLLTPAPAASRQWSAFDLTDPASVAKLRTRLQTQLAHATVRAANQSATRSVPPPRPTLSLASPASSGKAPLAAIALTAISQAIPPPPPLPAPPEASIAAQPSSPRAEDLAHAIPQHLMDVEEFRFIREAATRRGLRVYLFGGTAASYAHYVKWDLERQRGDTRYQPDRFDYDYMSIYRSTQDLDIVVDGTAAQANELQELLQNKFPYLQGSKKKWEVRPLKEPLRDTNGTVIKTALLDDFTFNNQHTDSNSTGMIELTVPVAGEPVVRDLRDWQAPQERRHSHFFTDVLNGELHYYYSPTHGQTDLAKAGDNPPILSAIRALTKAFQYELKIEAASERNLQKVITDFDPARDLKAPTAQRRFEDSAKKLFQHAVNLEYAAREMDRLGLRSKIAIPSASSESEKESAAWWINKKPLTSQAVGQGTGRTAAEVARSQGVTGEIIVAHETNSMLAWESITKSHKGDPNVFTSRTSAVDESALHGEGFYTKIGREGARGTGLTIRFTVDPRAREGTDFVIYESFWIIRNKAALRVIPESLNLTPLEFFTRLASGKDFNPADRGILEMAKRRMNHQLLANHSPQEAEQIFAIVKAHPDNQVLQKEWFSLPISTERPEWVEALIKKGTLDAFVATDVLSQPQWGSHPELVSALLKKGTVDEKLIQHVLGQPQWNDHPEWIEALFKKGGHEYSLIEHVLSQPTWQNHPEWVEALLKHGGYDQHLLTYALGQAHWANRPEWIEALLNKNNSNNLLIMQHVLSRAHWANHPEWVEALLKSDGNARTLLATVLNQPHWNNHPEWIRALMEKSWLNGAIAEDVLSQAHWRHHPELVQALIDRGQADEAVVRHVLSKAHWADHPEWMEQLIKRGSENQLIALVLMREAHWAKHPEFVQALLDRNSDMVDGQLVDSLAQQPLWANHPEFLETLIKRGDYQRRLIGHDFDNSHWKENPRLKAICPEGNVTVENLRAAFQRGATFLPSAKSPSTFGTGCRPSVQNLTR